ncbi:lipid-A-disaccharide synthase [Raineya orbicola]|uniref:Lipid-A-disaccharide synthase n=1 Tax=Raineya orbicola TaxID=2016530 RepID=A0A2N3IJY3_9BACT|nr:lipid-A-disaccharide synthase [Raineya orbicola]PKQ70624.1 lpxB: lipid-A-disaccharide synthase [Raineya orbicola]
MKYYLVVGERSGDLHASNLMKAIKNLDSQADFRFLGGEQMQAVGGTMFQHYKEIAVMGFLEVLSKISKIFKFLSLCKKDILNYQPDVVILVDFAGFNMRIARFCKKHNIRTFYYISPKIWAWNTKRAYKIKKYVDRMFVILPFEKDFYKKFHYEVDYVGNPLLDAINSYKGDENFFKKNNLSPQKPILAVLPGSRRSELHYILPIMLSCKPYFADFQWVVAGVDNVPTEMYDICKKYEVPVLYNQTYDLLAHAHTAIVTSGTATLETALFSVPQVVCYKGNALSYQIAKRLVQVRYISLVNLIMNQQVVCELIQNNLTTENLRQELEKIVSGEGREKMLQNYLTLKHIMGSVGASQTAAHKMIDYLSK